MASFVRISTEAIHERGYISRPDAVILLDAGLLELQEVNPLNGLRKGGIVLCNAPAARSEQKTNIVSLDVSGLALQLIGRNVVSAGIAAATCKVLGLAGLDSVLEGVRTETTAMGLKEELVERNLELARRCFAAAPEIGTDHIDALSDEKMPGMHELRYMPPNLSTAQVRSTGNSQLKKTGLWRISTPVIDYSKCTRCMVCYVYCPDSCITLEENLTPHIEYDNCKGCMICLVECPIRAIREEAVR